MLTWFKRVSSQSPAVLARRVGVDVGTRALKFVHAEQTGSGWRHGHALLLPYPCEAPMTCGDIAQGFVKAALEEVMPGGRLSSKLPVGCVFSMDLSCMQTLQLPPSNDAELRQMAESDLSESSDWNKDEQVYDVWPETALSSKDDGANTVNVLSIPKTSATALADDLLSLGMQCDSIDGLPFAAARAVSLATGKRQNPVAVLDWGASAATLVLCKHGRPTFTRRFRDCGFARCAEQIQERLDLPPADCHRLLQAIGMYSRDVCPMSSVSRVVSGAAAGGIRLIAEEIRRTFRFLRSDSGIQPEQLFLLGGGACIQHAGLRLTELTGIPTRPWQFPGRKKNTSAQGPNDAVFASAFAAALGGTS